MTEPKIDKKFVKKYKHISGIGVKNNGHIGFIDEGVHWHNF